MDVDPPAEEEENGGRIEEISPNIFKALNKLLQISSLL